MKRVLFCDAELVDPAAGTQTRGDLLVEGKTIIASGLGLADSAGEDVERIECGGQMLLPAVVDMHVYAPEPDAEHRETLDSLVVAAARGGVSDILLLPYADALPSKQTGSKGAVIHRAGALTSGLAGEHLAEMGLMGEKGARAFSNGRRAIASARVMRRAMAYASDLGGLVMHHAEDPDLAGDGVMHEGLLSARLGLAGIPAAAETIMIARDIHLASLTGAHYHAQQISCAGSVEIIRRAKQDGLPVSCGVSVHHLLLDENDIGLWRTFLKLSPPLRTRADREALVKGVAERVIDVIVSGHDPQDQETKRLPFAEASYGSIGVETLLAGALTLGQNTGIPAVVLLAALTSQPAALIGLEARHLGAGAPANLTLCANGGQRPLNAAALYSRAKNAALDGMLLHGEILAAMIEGKLVFRKKGAKRGGDA